MTVWIYVDTRYRVGHPDHIKAFGDPGRPNDGSRRTIPKASSLNKKS